MEDTIQMREMEQFVFFTYYVCIYHPDMQGRKGEMATYRVGLTFFLRQTSIVPMFWLQLGWS